MLGYGGTAIPHVPEELKQSLITQDVIEILDAENVTKAIFIGQGGGCPVISRIAQIHPDRMEACAFLAISYAPPNPNFNLRKVIELQEQQFGYSLFGYWEFLGGDPDAAQIISEKVRPSSITVQSPRLTIEVACLRGQFETFFNLTYPDDPKMWITHYAPPNAMKAYLLSDDPIPSPSWFSPKVPSLLTGKRNGLNPSLEQEKKIQYDGLHGMDINGPLTYYKAYLTGVQAEDSKDIPLARYALDIPVFFGAALDDTISLPSIGKEMTAKFCKHEKTRVHDFKANHWVHLHVPEQVNEALLDWLTSL
ncbi:hypothetical protein AAF712_013799 [Marasmius tenuissimus]|uniref:AB hydrolase-1 domain-containing protein n=1 Tax=Marasmius tenuissimus TaxID=585030 RepID=A0ABR2ZDN9_9AGAR